VDERDLFGQQFINPEFYNGVRLASANPNQSVIGLCDKLDSF
jgi:hypothetical protein